MNMVLTDIYNLQKANHSSAPRMVNKKTKPTKQKKAARKKNTKKTSTAQKHYLRHFSLKLILFMNQSVSFDRYSI